MEVERSYYRVRIMLRLEIDSRNERLRNYASEGASTARDLAARKRLDAFLLLV